VVVDVDWQVESGRADHAAGEPHVGLAVLVRLSLVSDRVGVHLDLVPMIGSAAGFP
jgi:hypothetical protein